MIKRRRKRNLKRRRQITLLLLLLTILIIGVGPYVWRIERLRLAESGYDVQKVKEELHWWEVHGGLLNKLGLIRDSNLWLDLNIGSADLESKLAAIHDDKHQFWLFLVDMQSGKTTEAQKVLGSLDNTTLNQLGQGLMSLTKGNAEESRLILTKTDVLWEKLPNHEQTLRHLTLAQVAMMLGDHPLTKSELQAAQRLEPQNPACLSLAFNVALEAGQWDNALELSNTLLAQTWRPKNSFLETKMAILAIHKNDVQKLSNCLAALKGLPRGDANIDYVNGVQALHKGHLQEGKNLLDRALKNGLDGELKIDAQKALKQVTDRQNADRVLRSIVD